MELRIHDRLLLLGLLPEKSDFTTLKIVMELRAALSFSEQEHKDFKIKEVPGEDGKGSFVQWEQEADKPKDISIGTVARDIITKALKDLDTKKQLTVEHMSLYERFVVQPTSPNGIAAEAVPATK